jgi:hypothetical protein
MLLLHKPVLVDLHLTHKGYYLDRNYESMLWETINYLKEGFDYSYNTTRKEFLEETGKIYAALIPELHLAGYLSKNFLSADFDFIYENRETIASAINDFYIEVLGDAIGKRGDWDEIGHPTGRSMEWCKRNYDQDVIEEYEKYLETWENLRIAMR